MAAEQKKLPTKKVTVYRNGDPSFRPVQYLYQKPKIRTFDKLLEDINRVAPPLRGGGVRSIYTTDGKRKIETLEEFEEAEQGSGFVACGTEPYKEVKGGYENIGKSKKDQQQNEKQTKDGDEKDAKKENQNSKQNNNQLKSKENEPKKEGSFVEMNKKKYGDQQRTDDQKIQNRVDVGDIKKITIYRNGDIHFKPKLYIYRSKVMRNWIKFLEEMNNLAPPMKGGSVRHVYTMDGEIEIISFDELENGQGYVVSGLEGYTTLKDGYENVGKAEKSPRKNPDQEQQQKETKVKPPTKRNPDEKLMNRRDQTHPDSNFFFIFKNGHGLEAKRFVFTPKQLDKGMPWFLEQVGKKYDIYAKKISTMDNRDVPTVNDLINNGAYVVIPLGESFRDTWYYLPALAKDTSADAVQDEENNGEEGDEEYDEDEDYEDKPQRRDRFDEKNRNERDRGNGRGQGAGGQDRRSRSRYSDDYYDEDYDSRTESGQEYYSDDDRRHNNGRGKQHNHRPDSSKSYCSYCDMLERHRQKHHYYSDDEDIEKEVSRRGSYSRPYTADDKYESPNRRKEASSKSRPPPTSDRRRQPGGSRRPSNVYDDEEDEPINRGHRLDSVGGRSIKGGGGGGSQKQAKHYDDQEFYDHPDTPPSKQKTNTSLRRAKSESNMDKNRNQNKQQTAKATNNKNNNKSPVKKQSQPQTNKKSNSAGQQPTNSQKAKTGSQTQLNNRNNKTNQKTNQPPTRSQSQTTLNKSNSGSGKNNWR